MLNIGPQELLLILVIALVVVGPQRLPELGRTIGRAMREFRKIQDDVKDTIRFDMDADPEPSVRPKESPAAVPIEVDEDDEPQPDPASDTEPGAPGDGVEPRAAG